MIVVYQRKRYGPQPPSTSHADQTRHRRSLQSPGPLYEVQDCSIHGRWPVVTDFRGVLDSKWFSGTSATVDDTIWAILQIDPSRLLKTTVLEGATRQLVPSWSAFNAILYPDISCSTNIACCPLLDASSTEFSSLYCHEPCPANKLESWTVGSCDYIRPRYLCQGKGNTTQVSHRVFQHSITPWKLSHRTELSFHNRKEASEFRIRRPANRVWGVCGW